MRFTSLTLVLSFSLLASNVSASPDMQLNKETMLKMISKSNQQECNSQSYLSCTEISKSDCLNMSKKFITSCVEPLPDFVAMDDTIEQSLDSCGEQIANELGIDMELLNECADEMDPVMNVDPDYDWTEDIDPQNIEMMLKNGMDIKDIEEMVTAKHLQQQNMEGFAEQMRVATATGSRLAEITLPLYQPHEITVHIADESVMDGVKFLPVISYKIKGSQDQALEFYKKRLPSFKQDPDDSYLLAEKIATGDNVYKYAQIPNIQIYYLDADTTLVQVYYRP